MFLSCTRRFTIISHRTRVRLIDKSIEIKKKKKNTSPKKSLLPAALCTYIPTPRPYGHADIHDVILFQLRSRGPMTVIVIYMPYGYYLYMARRRQNARNTLLVIVHQVGTTHVR